MTLLRILNQLLIRPLELFFEMIYGLARLKFEPGFSIVTLSLVMNLLLLPMYKRADAIQDEETETEKKLAGWVSHIKKTFRGDERFMMLQTYYRQNNYKPYYTAKGLLPLLLEIPFFMAAYHFLSNLEELNGTSFGLIANLGKQDGLITVFGLTLNALPIIMTLINFVSSWIYTKGLPLKKKLPLFGMAIFFLIILYICPSGLVLYWTLNNLFSLIKNLFLRIPALKRLFAGLGNRVKREKTEMPKPSFGLFFGGCVFLTLLCGVLIPSSVVLASPAEFVLISNFHTPLTHVLYAFLLAAGLFIIWFGIFYYLAGPRGKNAFSCIVWVLCGITIVNYMAFGTGLGFINAELQYEIKPEFSRREILINLGVILAVGALFVLIWKKQKKLVKGAYAILILAVAGMFGANAVNIQRAMEDVEESVYSVPDELAHFTLNKNGKNVVIIMTDRAVSSFLPFIMNEKPELKEQYVGFTYYPNTLSYGPITNIAIPALYGGYEYTPLELNKRNTEKLAKKHDEALKVMPTLFDNAGFDVTLCEPCYAGYTWIPNLKIFDDMPNIHTYLTEQGQFSELQKERQNIQMEEIWQRNFFCYSIMKASPLILQPILYQDGTYFKGESVTETTQLLYGMSVARGLQQNFLMSYATLNCLPAMSRIGDGDQNTFVYMTSYVTHEPTMLQTPNYEPAAYVDNLFYDSRVDRFNVAGQPTMRLTEITQMIHYHVNMAAILQIGKWLDYLRANDVYDNTRIIIVADHGRDLNMVEEWMFGEEHHEDIMIFNPLLMVKDFGETGELKTDETFMTNADVPTLAMTGLIEDPVNPFTGNPINSDPKEEDEQIVFFSPIYSTYENNGTTFIPGSWYKMTGHWLFDKNNWEKIGEW